MRTVDLEVDLRYLYPSEVHVMLEEVGIVADQVFGDFDGGPLTEDSGEMVQQYPEVLQGPALSGASPAPTFAVTPFAPYLRPSHRIIVTSRLM